MKKLQSINPFTGQNIATHEQDSLTAIENKIEQLNYSYLNWKSTAIKTRASILQQIATLLIDQKNSLGATMSAEMGKPIQQAIAEIEKCAWVCNYYAENGEKMLQAKKIKTDASQSFVTYQAMGIVFAIMPWNYPFWQLFRVLAPNLLLGNVVLLKHASNVYNCAKAIEAIFSKLQIEQKPFELVIVASDKVEQIIEHPFVKGVTLTGSEKAGASVAAIASKNIKKTVLELGGSNAVIILNDADLETHIDQIVNSRFQNTGQSCIAGKRFLVQEEIYDEFISLFTKKVKHLKSLNPNDKACDIGPMASEKLAEELENQLQKSIDNDSKIILGGKRNKAFFEATIVAINNTNGPIFKEETFGPIAAIKKFKTIDEAITMNNSSEFGLGASIFTRNIDLALQIQNELEEGAVFINSLVKSDPRLPFGGIKKSGYGRELSIEGLFEFANIKTVYVK